VLLLEIAKVSLGLPSEESAQPIVAEAVALKWAVKWSWEIRYDVSSFKVDSLEACTAWNKA